MTPPGKSTALKLPPYQDDADEAGFEAAIRNTAAARAAGRPSAGAATPASARDKLLAFPGFEPSKTPRRAAPPVEAPAPRADVDADPDLGAELEAALMSDLQSMVALFDEVARDGGPAPAAAVPDAPVLSAPPAAEPELRRSAPSVPAADPDQEALERLLASIRQGDGAPRREALPVDAIERPAPVRDFAAERDDDRLAAPLPPRDPASPRPGARDERLAPPIPRTRKAAPPKTANSNAARAPSRGKIASKAEPAPALRLAIPGAHRAYLKPAIAISALILLATIGAGMTIRALTARNDTGPAVAATTTDTAPVVAPATPTAAVAAAPEATATPAPSIAPAKIDTEALPASEPAAGAPRLAVDNSAATATAPMAAPGPVATAEPTATPEPATPVVAEAPAAPAPRVPLEPVVTANPGTIEAAQATAEPTAFDGVATLATETSAPQPVAKPAAAAAPKTASTAGAATGAGGLAPGAARIASGVKLRTNPDNGAPVIAVLGQGTAVEIVSCKGWCEIVAGDKRGFVYQKFLTAG